MVELLVVLAIVAILTATSMPALQSVLQGANLTQAGQTLTEEINVARQIASTRNTTVEVRLIQLAQMQNPSATGYNAIQLFRPPTAYETPAAGSNNMMPVSKLMILPALVVVSQDTTNYSHLLSGAAPYPVPMAVPGGQASYVAFHFMASGLVQVMNGATSVPSSTMSGLYLSAVPAIYGNKSGLPGSSGAPSNYVLVQINPNTGNTLVYRP